MAEKLSIQIALEGGDIIARQLKDIGEAGQQAFADIAKSAEQVGGFKNIKPEEVTAKLKDMGVTGVDSIEKIQKAVQSAGRLETLVQGITSVESGFAALAQAAPIVGAAIVGAITLATKTVTAFADATNKASAEAMKLGLTIGQFDRLQQGLQAAGISAEAITSGMQKLAQAVDKADLSKVTKAFTELQEASTRGFGAQGTAQLKILEETAGKAGAAGKTARESLEKLGLPIPLGVAKTLEELVAETGSADKALVAFIQQLQQMPNSAERSKLATTELGGALGTELIGALQTGSINIDQFVQRWNELTAKEEAAAASHRQSLNKMSADWERFKADIGAPIAIAGIEVMTALFDAMKGGIASTKQEFVALGSAIDTVATAGAAAIKFMTDAVIGLGTGIGQVVSAIAGITWSVLDAGVAAWNAVGAAIQSVIDKVLQFLGLQPAGGAPAAASGGGEGMAHGGLLGGRGSGTSDSNLAWVSRGEHIMPARAVAQPGVLALLEALRRSGGNLSAVLDGMNRFALGGMIRSSMPAFAAGGLAGGMSNVTIQFPGLPAIGGLRASSDVVDQLHRAAALAQVRSGGRKPSRYS